MSINRSAQPLRLFSTLLVGALAAVLGWLALPHQALACDGVGGHMQIRCIGKDPQGGDTIEVVVVLYNECRCHCGSIGMVDIDEIGWISTPGCPAPQPLDTVGGNNETVRFNTIENMTERFINRDCGYLSFCSDCSPAVICPCDPFLVNYTRSPGAGGSNWTDIGSPNSRCDAERKDCFFTDANGTTCCPFDVDPTTNLCRKADSLTSEDTLCPPADFSRYSNGLRSYQYSTRFYIPPTALNCGSYTAYFKLGALTQGGCCRGSANNVNSGTAFSYDVTWRQNATTCNNTPVWKPFPGDKASVCPGYDINFRGVDSVFDPINGNFLRMDTLWDTIPKTYTFDVGAIDPDGDSLVFDFDTCWQFPGQPANLTNATNYSWQHPFGTPAFNNAPPIQKINPQTGLVTWAPGNVTGGFTFCVGVREYRNGVLIGKYHREMAVKIFSSSVRCDPLPVFEPDPRDKPNVDSNGVVNIYMCEGDTLRREFFFRRRFVQGMDTTDTIEISNMNYDNGLPNARWYARDTLFRIPIEETSDPNDSTLVTYIGTLEWIGVSRGGAGGIGSWPFQVDVIADLCPVKQTYNQQFRVWVSPNNMTLVKASVVECNTVTFLQQAIRGQAPYTYSWHLQHPDSTPFDTNQKSIYQFPDTGVYKYYARAKTYAGCEAIDSGTVHVQSLGPELRASQSADTMCLSDTATFEYIGADSTAQITWFFGNNAVPSQVTGKGPHRVHWVTTGPKNPFYLVNRGNCEVAETLRIVINNLPFADAGSDIEYCPGTGPIRLNGTTSNASAACTYQWRPVDPTNPDRLSNYTIPNPTYIPTRDAKFTFQTRCGGCSSTIDTVEIKLRNTPSAIITGPNRYCRGGRGAKMTANVSGGTAPFRYEWFPKQGLDSVYSESPIAAPAINTTYRLVVQDQFGCSSDTVSRTIIVDTLPKVNAGPDVNLCVGGTGQRFQPNLNLDPTRIYRFRWVPGTGLSDSTVLTPFAQPSQTTTYELFVTDVLSGCDSRFLASNDTNRVTVYVTPPPIANAGPNVETCKNQGVQIGGKPQGGDPSDYQYTWAPTTGLSDPTVQTPTANPPHPITYTLRVTSRGCTGQLDSVHVGIKPVPEVTATPYYETCPGQAVRLTATATQASGQQLSWVWSPGHLLNDSTSPSPVATLYANTTFTVKVRDSLCFSSADTVTVDVKPMPLVDADTLPGNPGLEMCQGDTVVLPAVVRGNDPYEWKWLTTDGMLESGVVAARVSPTQTTTYYLQATKGQCQLLDSIRVVVHPRVDAKILAEGPTAFCQGELVRLVGSGDPAGNAGLGNAIAYRWTPAKGLSDANQAITWASPDTTTTYHLIVGQGPCTDTASVTITIHRTPKASFNTSHPMGCGEPVVAFENTSTNATGYAWHFGDDSPVSNVANPVHRYSRPGTYTVTLRALGAEGRCVGTQSTTKPVVAGERPTQAVVATPTPPATLVLPKATVDVRDQTPNARKWLWTFGDGATATTQQATHTWQQPGTYTVTLVAEDGVGCAYTAELGPYEVLNPELGLEPVSAFTPNGDGIQDRWNVGYTGVETYQLRIFDRWGQTHFASTDPKAMWDGTKQGGSRSPNDVYYYVIEIGSKIYKGTVTLMR